VNTTDRYAVCPSVHSRNLLDHIIYLFSTTVPWLAECWGLMQRVPESDRNTVLKMLRGVVE
jgi:hypothetical protein